MISQFVFFWPPHGSVVHLLTLNLVIALPLSVLAQLTMYHWIEVSEEGLTIRALFLRQSIRWQEARLFAIYATVKTTALPDHYELSSATTILRWSRKLTSSRLTRFSSPFQDYSQHIESLLALIVARTGLPLYDLRDWEVLPLPAPPAPELPVLWRGE